MPEVERVSGIAPAEFAEHFERQERPVVLRGAIKQWQAVERWTPAFLAQRLGPVQVSYKVSSSHVHPDFRAASLREMFALGRSTFAEFLQLIQRSDGARYLFTGDEQFLLRRRDGHTTINEDLRPLLDDVQVPDFVPEDRLYTVWSWFSGRGVRTWLHYDNNGCHNLNAQITGTKRCVLYSPHELGKLHPFPLGGANPAHNCSEIDVEAVDATRFSAFRGLEAHEALVEPGDLLFIPAWWFHTFHHLGSFNANVNFWWKPRTPPWNPVAARQAIIDAVTAAGVDTKASAPHAELLRAIDSAAVARRSA